MPLANNTEVIKLFEDSEFEGKITSLKRIDYEMLNTYKSKDFMHDYLHDYINNKTQKCNKPSKDNRRDDIPVITGVGAPHEKLSAILVKEEYGLAIHNVYSKLIEEDITEDDLEFIARMIIGCTYKRDMTPVKSIKNCIISLLNSNSIDVDSLDYIVRDAYNSGIDNWSLDFKRLVESFTIAEVTVFENVEVNNLNIDGVWLKNSCINNKKWTNGTLEGKAEFRNFKLDDIDCIEFVNNNIYEKGYSDTESNTVISRNTSKIQVIYPKREFELELKDNCKLSGNFTGKINGKFLGKMALPETYKVRTEYILAFKKTCISVIQSAIEARNHEYLWVYSHPKVVYSSIFLQRHLLWLSAKFLCCKKNNKSFKEKKLDFSECNSCKYTHETEEEIISEIIGFESFLYKDKEKTKSNFEEIGYRFYRSCDDDLNSLFKSIYLENEKRGSYASAEIKTYFESYFYRKHKKPIWKSFVDFIYYFSKCSDSEIKDLIEKITSTASAYNADYGILSDNIQTELEKFGMKNAVFVKSKLQTRELDPSSTFIVLGDNPVWLCDILDKSILKNKFEKDIFYIYVDLKETDDPEKKKNSNENKDPGKSKKYFDIPAIVQTLRNMI